MSRSLSSHALLLLALVGCGGKASGSPASGGHAAVGEVAGGGAAGVVGGGMGGAASDPVESAAGAGATGAGDASNGPVLGDEALSCTKNSECTLAMTRCCACQVTSLTQVVALNVRYRDDYEAALCADTTSCQACYQPFLTYLFAACENNRCAAVDIYQTPIVACSPTSPCKIRDQRCCGCGNPSDERRMAIGAEQDQAYESLRCDPGQACAECAVSLPSVPDGYLGCFDGRCAIGGLVHWPSRENLPCKIRRTFGVTRRLYSPTSSF